MGLVFAVALLNKVRSRARRTEFVAATRRLAPDWLGRLVPVVVLAATVVVTEVCIVMLLSVPGPADGAWHWAMGLAGIFAAAVGVALRRDDRSPRNCSGASTRPLGLGQLMRRTSPRLLRKGGIMVTEGFGASGVLEQRLGEDC